MITNIILFFFKKINTMLLDCGVKIRKLKKNNKYTKKPLKERKWCESLKKETFPFYLYCVSRNEAWKMSNTQQQRMFLYALIEKCDTQAHTFYKRIKEKQKK